MEELKDLLKSIVKVLIPCAIIALIIFVLVKIQPEEEIEPDIPVNSLSSEDSQYILENDKLKFTLDAATTQFDLQVKGTDTVWYSNPKDSDNDSIALPAEKNNMKSTLLIKYGSSNGVWVTYNNYSLSILNGLYDIKKISDNSLRIDYTIGNIKKEYIIPLAVPESRFNEFVDKMEKKPAKQVKEYYRRYDIKKLRKTDNKEELLAKYPDLEKEPMYVLLDTTADFLRKKIENLFAEVGYTYDDYIEDLSRYEVVSSQDSPIFNVPIIYTLEADNLVVSVPMNEIQFKKDNPIINIDVLPYFGTGSTEDDGYIIVPESGGAVINFNNGRNDQAPYVSNVYGWDYGSRRDAVVYETKNAFPLYGICRNGSSFICLSEGGQPYATIKADVSGRLGSYNYCYFDYSILHYEYYDLTSKADSAFYVFEDKLPDEDIVQRYHFCQTDDYVELADSYRNYLLDRYPALNRTVDPSVPTVISVLEAVDKVQQKWGVPISTSYKLSSYEETADIIEDLSNSGFENMRVKLLGWMNGGYTHSMLNDIDLISVLGGKKAFNKMLTRLSDMGVKTYLDAQTEFAYRSDIFDGFVTFKDAARFTTREQIKLYPYSIIWYGSDDFFDEYYLLKPQESFKQIDVLNKFVTSKNVGVSYRNIGNITSADYNPKNLYTRSKVIEMQRDMLDNANIPGGYMFNFGDDFVLDHADIITNMDVTNSNSAIIDYDIPFYQIAIHGLVNYTSTSINLAEDYEEELLKSAEYGAGISFLFMNEEPGALQDTLYTEYFGAAYSLWADKAKDIYTKYKNNFNGLNDQKITGHKLAGDNVRITEYENGSKVYVNFGYKDEVIDSITVPARDYVVKGGETR